MNKLSLAYTRMNNLLGLGVSYATANEIASQEFNVIPEALDLMFLEITDLAEVPQAA